MPVAQILLIEDDEAVREGLRLGLGQLSHVVQGAVTGHMGLDFLQIQPPDVVILDLMLPGMDGFEVCRRIRSASSVPIIMLTARGDDVDVVSGLEAGADDYVIKPVQPRVLDARIRAVLRRGETQSTPAAKYGDLTIDYSSLIVAKHHDPLILPPTELRLLLTLSAAPEQVFSRQQLLQSVWEHEYLGDSRLVDACVQRLRAKIEDNPAQPVYIQTVRGFGYRFGPV